MTTTQTTYRLIAPFRNETYTFRPQADGTVVLDHRYPQGLPGRPGVGLYGVRLGRAEARERWDSARKAGWVRAD